jgi:hypothetical protein
MKISVDDLKKAIDWITANSLDTHVQVIIQEGKLFLKCMDKYQVSVEIKIFEGSGLMPKIKKETNL